ncbi:hypothetical protein BSL78_07376 [Apostichopus japonicus]|uniref:Transmembrane protein n=1 Tax=Stichopus japonicus TaxID=307972 RepID=A0A2G8L628_STIJA|nr:hypothetical protein BSL78_07376 [Apostichopus japonicus]
MEGTFRGHTGFASEEAMQKLCDVIEEEVNSYETELERNGTVLSLIGQRASLRLHADVVFSWISALSLLSCGFLLLVASAILPDVYTLIEAAFLILFCALNLYLSGWNFHLKQRELIDQSRSLLKDMKGEWSSEDYLPLHSPQSSSISLQWTYRDGELVNLPQALLVEGDIIVVRPGRPVPGGACNVQDSQMTLTAGEVFLPEVEGTVTDAAVRVPLQPEKFVMLETPYRRFLNECLQKGNHRPVTLLENRRLMGCHFIERVIIPLILVRQSTFEVKYFVVTIKIPLLGLTVDANCWALSLLVHNLRC